MSVLQPPHGDSPIRSPHTDQHRLRVLVADDNRDAADALALLISLWGYDTRVAYDGAEALTVAADYQPHVFLLDISMPNLDGYGVARQLRQRQGPQCPTLVAVTGYADETHRRLSVEAGFDHYLVKPSDVDLLQRILTARAEGREPAYQAAAAISRLAPPTSFRSLSPTTTVA